MLASPPYARATPCAGPCPSCGSDGLHDALSGAALVRELCMREGDTLAHAGLWASLPEGVRALRLVIGGPALRDGLVTPTAARVASLDDPAEDRGAHFTTALVDGERALVASLHDVPRRCVVTLTGFARAVGEGALSLRLVADRGGCLAQRVLVRVAPSRAQSPAGFGAYAAFACTGGAQAARVARWVDRVAGALVAGRAWPERVSLRATFDAGGALDASARADARGVGGDAWRSVLRAVARGAVSSVELCDPRDPDAAFVSVAPTLRARPAPCEASAWAEAGAVVDGGALLDAWWSAAEHEGTLQSLAGALDEPVTPRVVTAWERARGMTAASVDAAWMERFVRAPGARAWCRGALWSGEEVARCWPGPVRVRGAADATGWSA